MDALRRIVRVLRVSDREAERRHGISGAQLFVLQRLAERPSSTLGDLADRTSTHASSVSIVVSRLVTRGLVSRTSSPEDARRREIALTPAGRRLLARAPRAVQASLIEALEKLPSRALQELSGTLGQVAAATGPSGAVPPLFFEDRMAAPEPGRRRASVRPPRR